MSVPVACNAANRLLVKSSGCTPWIVLAWRDGTLEVSPCHGETPDPCQIHCRIRVTEQRAENELSRSAPPVETEQARRSRLRRKEALLTSALAPRLGRRWVAADGRRSLSVGEEQSSAVAPVSTLAAAERGIRR